MKKSVFGLAAALPLLFLTSCAPENVSEVNVFNWSYYIPEDVRAQFVQETGIKLNYEEFDTNEAMLAKVRTGVNYDVCFPGAEFVPVMISDGFLEEIDSAKLSNYNSIDESFYQKADSFDPGNRYAVPYNVGTIGVVYWKDEIPNPPHSLSILLDPAYKNRIAIMDDTREVYGAAMAYLGFSGNSTNTGQIAQATRLILRWKANALKFETNQMATLFASKEVLIALNFPENILSELDPALADNAAFFLPREGGLAYMDCMVILKNGKNKENAYAFIDFILRPDILARIYDAFGFPGISSQAKVLQTGTPYYTASDLEMHNIRMPLYENNYLYTTPWEEEIKIGN
ncbi:MAG: spermidine/putrescine ABC transporter substrate-binding protein [Spirochaetales bacterium]|nr:spermidine/putrescine ABC transporter substrate-binding protein [Spirochaetales bacterium]